MERLCKALHNRSDTPACPIKRKSEKNNKKKHKKLNVKYITSNMLPLTNYEVNFKPHFWDFILIVFEISRL